MRRVERGGRGRRGEGEQRGAGSWTCRLFLLDLARARNTAKKKILRLCHSLHCRGRHSPLYSFCSPVLWIPGSIPPDSYLGTTVYFDV